MSIDDDVKPAREARAVYNIMRDALFASYNWSFAKERAAIPALVAAPPFGFSFQYQIPSDALRILFIGDYYAGLDLSSYRSAPTQLYEIEQRKILTNLDSPLHIKYVKQIVDSTQWTAQFTFAFVAKLAELLAEPLTQSEQKRARAESEFNKQISLAIRANAIEMPPEKLPDDEWLMSRL